MFTTRGLICLFKFVNQKEYFMQSKLTAPSQKGVNADCPIFQESNLKSINFIFICY